MEKRYVIQLVISFLAGAGLVGLAAIWGEWIPSSPWYLLGALIGGGSLAFILIPVF
jgi:hypothetical protein